MVAGFEAYDILKADSTVTVASAFSASFPGIPFVESTYFKHRAIWVSLNSRNLGQLAIETAIKDGKTWTQLIKSI